jgi:hypothetical protein
VPARTREGETTIMNPNHNPAAAHQRRGSRRAARRWARSLARLAEAGRQDGADAAAWWQQYALGGRTTGDVTATAARVLAGLENLEPRVLDTLPAAPFSDALIEQVYTEHTSRLAPVWRRLRPPQRVAALDAYRDAYENALHQQVAAYCRQVLDTDPADQAHTPTHSGGSQRGGAR